MRIIITIFFLFQVTTIFAQQGYTYEPDDKKFYDTIAHLDSIFFSAYNTCSVNLEVYARYYSESLEFFHDRNGLMQSKKDVVEGTRKYVCGKVKRVLIPNSIEVYPVKDYGAIEMGLHKFINNTEPPRTPSHISRFIIFWQRTDRGWKITKVISLH